MSTMDTIAAVEASGETKLTDAELQAARKYDTPEYERLCSHLGFLDTVHFVKVDAKGRVGFTLGKPNEIANLRDAVAHAGYTPTPGLARGGR